MLSSHFFLSWFIVIFVFRKHLNNISVKTFAKLQRRKDYKSPVYYCCPQKCSIKNVLNKRF